MRTRRRFGLVLAIGLGAVLAPAARAAAQQFEFIKSFGSDEGNLSRLVAGPAGELYGTGAGTVFRIDPDGSRTILHQFEGTGPGGCGSTGITVGVDGVIYGFGTPCGVSGSWTIFRISDGTYSVLQEVPPPTPMPDTPPVAGANGALYWLARSGLEVVAIKWDGEFRTVGTLISGTIFRDLIRAPDGNIYFPTSVNHSLIDIRFGSVLRITPDDRLETVVSFGGLSEQIAPDSELILGLDGALYGVLSERHVGSRIYRLTTAGTLSYPPGYPIGVPSYAIGLPLAVGVDRSIYLALPTVHLPVPTEHGALGRLTSAGSLELVHTFTGSDGHGPASPLVRGMDGHLYGTTFSGGEHGLGVFFRIRMPSVDVKVNGADEPMEVGAGEPLTISLAFDASATEVMNPSEVYMAIVTPALQILWSTPSGFSLTPEPIYTGPLPSFPSTPLINIPDAAVMPLGDYYWVAIVDEDANGVPNGHYVDFVKTTKAASATALQQRR